MKPSLSIIILFMALASQATASTTWYVNGMNGNDNNDCKSRQHACKTIGHAISLASSGDSVRVAATTYKENLTINFSLKILGASATSTVLDGQGIGGNMVYIPNRAAHVTLSKLTIRNGGNVGGGGGIVNYATLTVDDAIITGNRAEQGAGIENAGTITINRSTVSKNSADGGYDTYGGGIFNSSTARLMINDSTLVGNVAHGEFVYGGAIYNEGGVLVINNSTLTRNKAPGYGGAIVNDYQGTVTISNSTISENTASSGGGSAVAGFPMTFQNSIVADNHPGGNCSKAYRMISNGYNLSSDGTCHFHKTGDVNNTEPKLGMLGNHGGPTQTIPEMLGSPTVDAGNPNGCTDGQGHLLKTDQRGYPRPGRYKSDKRCDMGAFERQSD
jgi:hypothetical protein